MLGYVVGALAWGFLKSWSNDLTRSHSSLAGLGVSELLEELQFRTGLEYGVARQSLKMSPPAARLCGAVLFGLVHPGNMLDAALGGVVYSKAYESHGLLGSTLTHIAHNWGVYLGGK